MRALFALAFSTTLLASCSSKTEDVDDFDVEDDAAADDGSSGDGSSGDGSDGGSGDGSSGDGSDGGSGGDPFDSLSGDPTSCDLTDRAFTLDLQSGRFVEPPGVADLLLGQLESDFTIGISAHSGGSVEGFLGSTDGAQDPCQPTTDLPTGDWDDPVLDVGPQTVSIDLAGLSVPLDDLRVAFVVDGDCEGFTDGVMAAELDARSLAPLLGDVLGTDDPDEVCDVLTGFGVTCAACASDGADYCIGVLATDIPGAAPRFEFDRITSSDVSGDPDCR
jgi:hypothetical protein